MGLGMTEWIVLLVVGAMVIGGLAAVGFTVYAVSKKGARDGAAEALEKKSGKVSG